MAARSELRRCPRRAGAGATGGDRPPNEGTFAVGAAGSALADHHYWSQMAIDRCPGSAMALVVAGRYCDIGLLTTVSAQREMSGF